MKLVWWGEGIPPGRYDVRDGLSDAERRNIEVRLDQPARIVGQIDRKAFSRADHISVHSASVDHVSVQLKPEQTRFEIPDLAAGTYRVTLMGERQRTSQDSFTSNALNTVEITLEAGDEKTVFFGEPNP